MWRFVFRMSVISRLHTLMNILLKNKRYSDAEKASEDEEYREELYKEYKI